jgi:hypothetical protein
VAIEVGLAVMATVGAGDGLPMVPPAHPVNRRGSKKPGAIEKRVWRMRAFVTIITFLSLTTDLPCAGIRGHVS